MKIICSKFPSFPRSVRWNSVLSLPGSLVISLSFSLLAAFRMLWRAATSSDRSHSTTTTPCWMSFNFSFSSEQSKSELCFMIIENLKPYQYHLFVQNNYFVKRKLSKPSNSTLTPAITIQSLNFFNPSANFFRVCRVRRLPALSGTFQILITQYQ